MLSCKEYSDQIKKIISEEVSMLPSKPKLVVIQIGDDPASNSYVKGKEKDCAEVGFISEVLKFPNCITEKNLLEEIYELNDDNSCNGIIVQLPIPNHINVKSIQNAISPEKDVDGFNINSSFKACTPLGAINYLKHIGYDFTGKNACVVGRSEIIGKPLARMLLDLNATVTVCHSKTKEYNLQFQMIFSDLIFLCTNQIDYYDIKYFLEASVDVIDFGIGRNSNGKLCGCMKKETVEKLKECNQDNIIISGIGGTGLLTRVALLSNTLEAYKKQIINCN